MRTRWRRRGSDAYVERLRGVPLFAGCSAGEVERAAALTTPVVVPAGAALCTAGRLARECLVVLRGEAVATGPSEAGEPVAAGAVVGAAAVLGARPHERTVMARTEVEALSLTARELLSLLLDCPGVARAISAAALPAPDGGAPALSRMPAWTDAAADRRPRQAGAALRVHGAGR